MGSRSINLFFKKCSDYPLSHIVFFVFTFLRGFFQVRYLLIVLFMCVSSSTVCLGSEHVITPVLAILLNGGAAGGAGWGANPVDDSQRPERAWLDQFNGITPVSVTTIDAALQNCTPEAYCVLEVDQLELTDTVYLNRPKTKIIGKAGNKIVFSGDYGGGGAFIQIEDNASEIVLQGLNLDGKDQNYNRDLYGIIVEGENINKIAVIDCEIHHIYSNDNAHAIAVYGAGATEDSAIQNVIIEDNNIHDMHTGTSESVAINGNVKHWEIVRNQISHVNNIAIGMIGGEGISPVQIIDGRTFPGTLDAARYGFVEQNSVIDMSTVSNPGYGNAHSWAGGIYVDGARDINITGNSVDSSEWGYDIGVENCVTPNNILLENNVAANSYYGDLLIGAYAHIGYNEDSTINCNPTASSDENEGHGYVENVTVKANQFNTASPSVNSVEFSYRLRQSVIIHPGVTAQNPDGGVTGDENSFRITE